MGRELLQNLKLFKIKFSSKIYCKLIIKTSHIKIKISAIIPEVIGLVNELIKKQVRVIAIKQNLDIKQHDITSKVMITLFSLFSELERDLISLRTKEALASKKAQVYS